MVDYKVLSCDTDSILFNRKDGKPITEDEQKDILERINSLFPARIRFEDDGYFPSVIIFAAKNYVLYDGEKAKIKGSALKDQKKEPALKEFQTAIVQSIIAAREDFKDIYLKYVKEIMNVQEISRWSSKKGISQKTLSSPRTNEKKIRDAIQGTEYVLNDKIYVFFREDETLCLQEHFNGDYNRATLLKKLYKVTQLFDAVLPTKELFLNYALKKNQKDLANII